MKKTLTYILKGFVIAVVSILAILILAVLLLQTAPAKKRIAAEAEKQATRFLNGKLSIGSIEGNFYSHLTLSKLSLRQDGDTMIFIKEVRLRYHLWPLLKGALQVDYAGIDSPRLKLKQLNDSTWNIGNVIKPSPESASSGTGSTFHFDLADFRISGGTLLIDSPDTLLPRKVDRLHTRLSLKWHPEAQEIRVDSFSLVSAAPDIVLKQLTFRFRKDSARMELNDLKLLTGANRLKGQAAWAARKQDPSAADIVTDSLQTKEFAFFLPQLNLPATPVVKAHARFRNDSLLATLALTDKGQKIELDLQSGNFSNFMSGKNKQDLSYRLKGKLTHVDLSHWLGQPELKYLINGRLVLNGTGTDWKKAVASLQARFTESRIVDYPIDELDLNLRINQGNLGGQARGKGNFGAFIIHPTIRGLSGDHPEYRLLLTTRNLNIAQLTGADSLRSDINLQAKITGRDFDPNSLQARAAIRMMPSTIAQVRLDTLFANLNYHNQQIDLDSLRLQTGSLLVDASGIYSLRSASDLHLSARFDSISEFSAFLPVDSLTTSGQIRAHLTGEKDSLHLLTSLRLNRTGYKDFFLESLQLDAQTLLTKNDTVVSAKLKASKPGNKTYVLDSLTAQIEGRPDSILLDTRVRNKDLDSRLNTWIVPGKTLRLILNEWMIHYREQQWALRQPPARIEVDSLAYRIDNFRMASGQTDSSQFVLADGIIRRQGEEDFRLEIANLDLSKLAEAFRLNMDASGFLNLNAKMNGTASSPQLKGDFNLQEAVLNEYPMKKTEGRFDYTNNRMNLSATVIPRDSGKIVFSGHVPLKLKLDSMQATFNPKDRINAQLEVQRFPFAVLNAFIMADEVKGLINGKVTLDGTVDSPDPKGRIAMKQGSFKMNKYGIDYRTIDFAVNFLAEKIALDTLFIRSDDGRMTGTGQMDFNSVFYKGDVKRSAINLHFNKFNPFNHDQFNMQLSGRANLSGEKGKVVFDGDLKVPQSEIFLPTVLSMFGKVSSDELPEPILIREMNRMKAGNDTLTFTGDTLTARSDTVRGNNDTGADPGAGKQIAEKDSTAPNYLDNVTGKIKLNIPRNTWIKSDDMHIELSGDLELRKNKDFFELFGIVDVVRGQYDLLGKTFVIDQGSVRFQGGEEIKPQLDITASYGFRASGTIDQNLTVHVRGTAESPKVSFSMAGDSINEGDALSYILFGRGMNELTADQQANVAGSGGGTIAGKAAASLISSQLSDFLGQKLNMDYLEIKSDAGFENTTIVVGKYITNNIFMSYEQRVGEKSDRDERATYEVRLEYELFKFLFFQLNSSSTDSGFDVIFKLNSRGRGSGPSM